ncbi:DUF5011 domain-containing protein [Romboutsia ilealis]|uniref:DUF5011 domain-containing protein n=1 Tax=Romboutsia faecis TaxID=2764597 RepID=A0ABR7JQF4_9FIRM|nr:DUF5011 domain-containing protein [Romboutsia faecis]MBC5997153.1 DUF5011 domain-containing protein [Romboutsia faecis]MRN23434.1 DUF5011 domain-containing protein [Romboutsia ilealis]
MTKLKPSVKAAIASTLVLTSTAAIACAVPKLTNEKATSAEHQLKLDVERVDSDTVKVAIDNIQDIPKAIQFSIKLDGATLKDGENSIKDLVKKEVEKRLKNDEYLTTSNSILTDYTYNEVKNTIDVLITSENSLPKTENKLEVFELDIKGLSDSTQSYKVVPNNEKEYKYVSNTNKEYNDLVVTHENKDITINTAPIITSEERYINIVEGEKLELTPKILKEKIGLEMQHEDGVENLTLEVKKDNKVITEFTENTPGIYELEITAVKENTIKSEPLKIQVNVALDNVTKPPTITMNEEQLTDITISGGSIFKPLEGVKAVDKKGRNVDVDVKVDKDLDLDPEQNTDYVLTYTATDIYGNKATKQITLTVVANQAPVILGVKDHTISVGDKFDPMNGVTVTDEDKNIELKVDSNVNTNIAGEYKVSYSATDSKGKVARAQSKVTVNPKSGIINRIPTIIASDKTIKVGDKFNPLEGVTANDEEEGDLTHRIKVVANDVDTYTAGTYTVKYQVADSKGATTTKEITVTVKSDIVLAKNIAINNKSDNKVYIGGSKTITASVDENADLKEIDWKISDSSIAELRIVRNEARITAKSKGQVTLTALTTDGSDLSDTITINVSIFEEDSEVPSYVKDVVDTDVLTPVSGLGIEESPIEFEVKDVTVDKLDKFLDNLESLDYELISINQDDDFTIYKIKVSNKGRIFRLFKSTEDTYISIKVSKSLDNANEINDRLEKLADKGTEKPVNSKPIIFIEGLNTNITVGDTFNPLDGVTAFDEEDGDLTDSIKVSGKVDTTKSGKYTLKYTVKDSQGEENSITIDITVSEKTGKPEVIKGEKPVIKVTSSIDTITVGDKFDPLSGISAYDKEDGDLTASIKVSGSVNTSKVGEYKLTYTVEDKDGNVSTFTRIIFVKEKVISTNESNNPKTGDSSILGYVSIFTIAAGGLFIKRKNLK